MTALHDRDDRDVIPRWRDFGTAIESGELDPVGHAAPPSAPQPAHDLHEATAAFERDPGLHTAGDLVGQATVLGLQNTQTLDAARFVLEDAGAGALRELASALLSGHESNHLDRLPAPFDWRATVRRAAKLKNIVRAEPRNAVRWTDLGLAHLNLGATTLAERNIRTALALEPLNRYVLRSAVRLFVLLDDPETAHHFLNRHPAALNDPWIRAADLATTEVLGRPPTKLRATKQILESGRWAPWHFSELAGQLATTELRSGQIRQAKRTMRRALLDPTENAVAQAEWASQHGIDPPTEGALEAPRSFEARALASAQAGDLEAAIAAARGWQSDQPFDPAAAVFVSYLASVGVEDYELGEQSAKQGLIANAHHGLLRNNLVFALASQGKLTEAREQLALIPSPETGSREGATLTATRGLVAFRSDDAPLGRRLYDDAVSRLEGRRETDVAALAAMIWAREELNAHSPEASNIAARALELAKRAPTPEVQLWRHRLLLLLEQNSSTAGTRLSSDDRPGPAELTS